MAVPILWLLIATLVTTLTGPSVQQTAGRLRLELTLTKSSYVVGEPVGATLTVRVAGEAPLRVQFASGQRFDLIVRRRGVLIWRWAHDKAFIQLIQEVTLRPGEVLTFSGVWSQVDLQGRRVEPGEYEMVGLFLARGADLPGGLETPPLGFQVRE